MQRVNGEGGDAEKGELQGQAQEPLCQGLALSFEQSVIILFSIYLYTDHQGSGILHPRSNINFDGILFGSDI